VRPAIVRRRDGSEALLTSSIPDLQLDGLVIELDRADFLRTQSTSQDHANNNIRTHAEALVKGQAGSTHAHPYKSTLQLRSPSRLHILDVSSEQEQKNINIRSQRQ